MNRLKLQVTHRPETGKNHRLDEALRRCFEDMEELIKLAVDLAWKHATDCQKCGAARPGAYDFGLCQPCTSGAQ